MENLKYVLDLLRERNELKELLGRAREQIIKQEKEIEKLKNPPIWMNEGEL